MKTLTKRGMNRPRLKSMGKRERRRRDRSGMAELKVAGVSGFIEKGISVNEFLDTIRAVARGKKVVLLTGAPDVAERGIQASRRIDESLFGRIHLTGRERDVFSMIAAGLSKSQIAARLRISLATLNRHLSRILRQINASERAGR